MKKRREKIKRIKQKEQRKNGKLEFKKRLGFMVTPHWGVRVGCLVTPRWGSWFQGYSPLGERRGWVACVLPTWGEGGLYGYFPLGSWFLVSSRWGSWFQGYSLLEGEGGLHEYSPLGE